MKVKITLLIVILSFISVLTNAQEKVNTKRGLRIGVDLTPMVLKAFEPESGGLGISLDYEFIKDFFATIEGGYLNYNSNHSDYKYTINGNYALVGFDYNVFRQELKVDNDIFFVGIRYGFSKFEQQAENFTLTNYWGTYTGNYDKQQLSGQWVELTGGLKAELYFAKNVFIGWTVRSKILLSGKNNDIMNPYIIPGYGKTEKSFKFNISWFVSYLIPFKK